MKAGNGGDHMASWRSLGGSDMQIGEFSGLHEDVTPAARPLGLLSRIRNLRMGPAPALSTRQGLSLVGAAQAGVSRGIHRYQNLSGATVQLFAGFGVDLKKYNPSTGAWDSVGALSDSRWTAANISSSSDYAVFFTGSTPKKWNGSSLSTLLDAPQGRYVVEAYQQLFVGGITGRENDLDFCDVALPEEWNPDPTNDAGSITVGANPIRWVGFDRVQGKVLIWTTRSVEQLNGPETPNRPDLWSVRTVAQEGTPCGFTVQNLMGTWIWLADDAFCLWSGSSLAKVVEPFKASFDLIDWAKIADAASWVTQEGEYVCSVPKIGGGVLWFIYDPDNGWMVATGPDVRSFGVFEFNGRAQTVLGDSVGKVYTVGGADDAGSAIEWSCEIGPTVLEAAFEHKNLLRVDVVVTLAEDATANAALSLTDAGENWGPTYALNGSASYGVIRIPVSPSRANVFRLKLWGTGQATIHDVRFRFAQGRR